MLQCDRPAMGWRAVSALVVVAATSTSCGGTGHDSQVPNVAGNLAATVPSAVLGNQIVFGPKQSRSLLSWAKRFQSCVAARGFASSMHVTRSQFTIEVDEKTPKSKLLSVGVACGDALGGPPPRASLQTFDGTFVLYLPKQCLLDARVAREAR
jgi:hypothetical protein